MVSKNWDQSFFWFTTWKIWIASGSFSTSFIYQLHQQHQISASFYLNIILNKNWTVENTILIEKYVCRNFQNSYKNVAKTLVFKLLWNGTYLLLGFNFFFLLLCISHGKTQILFPVRPHFLSSKNEIQRVLHE